MINSFFGQYRWLSNFSACCVKLEGESYPSVENAYQAAKTMECRKAFQSCPPGKAKRLGKKVKIRIGWEQIKIALMRSLLEQKFELGTDLYNRLIATGNQELVEGNTWGDTFWGVCGGVGENHLGKLLMDIREKKNEI